MSCHSVGVVFGNNPRASVKQRQLLHQELRHAGLSPMELCQQGIAQPFPKCKRNLRGRVERYARGHVFVGVQHQEGNATLSGCDVCRCETRGWRPSLLAAAMDCTEVFPRPFHRVTTVVGSYNKLFCIFLTNVAGISSSTASQLSSCSSATACRTRMDCGSLGVVICNVILCH